MDNNKAYFKDIFDKKSRDRDSDIGKIKLPWNNQIIDIIIQHDVVTYYRPIIDHIAADITSRIGLEGDYFTQQDLDDYIEKVEEYSIHEQWYYNTKKIILMDLYKELTLILPEELLKHIKCYDYWNYIYSDIYTLNYNPDKQRYSIQKFNIKQPIDRRFYYWNTDKTFDIQYYDNRKDARNKFIQLIKEEYIM